MGPAEKKMLLITGGVFLSIILILGGSFYYLKFVKLAALNEQVAQIDEEIKKENDKSNEMIKWDKGLELYKNNEKKFHQQLPKWDPLKPMSSDFLEEIGSLLKSASPNIEMPTFKLSADKGARNSRNKGPAGPMANLKKMSVSFEVKGRFFSLANFIYRVETSTRFFLIEELELKPLDSSGAINSDREESQLKVKISTYFYTGS